MVFTNMCCWAQCGQRYNCYDNNNITEGKRRSYVGAKTCILFKLHWYTSKLDCNELRC